MADTVEAVFERGVFRPLDPVELPDGQRVVLSVAPIPRNGPTAAEQLNAWRAVYEGLAAEDIAEVERISQDRSYFSRRTDEDLA